MSDKQVKAAYTFMVGCIIFMVSNIAGDMSRTFRIAELEAKLQACEAKCLGCGDGCCKACK